LLENRLFITGCERVSIIFGKGGGTKRKKTSGGGWLCLARTSPRRNLFPAKEGGIAGKRPGGATERAAIPPKKRKGGVKVQQCSKGFL